MRGSQNGWNFNVPTAILILAVVGGVIVLAAMDKLPTEMFGVKWATPSPEPSQSSIAPSLPPLSQPSIKSSSFSARLLTNYAQSLTDRDFVSLERIYPKGNEATQRKWLQGTSEDSPIATVQVVGQPERIIDSENEVTLQATMQYCRQDQSGSTDTKNYTFVQNEGAWQLDSMSAPENVTEVQC